MTPPTFDHAPECPANHEHCAIPYAPHDGPHVMVRGVCTCGATRAKAAYEAGWNAAVEECAELAESCPPPHEDPQNPSSLNDVERSLCDAATLMAAKDIAEAIRKLKKP